MKFEDALKELRKGRKIALNGYWYSLALGANKKIKGMLVNDIQLLKELHPLDILSEDWTIVVDDEYYQDGIKLPTSDDESTTAWGRLETRMRDAFSTQKIENNINDILLDFEKRLVKLEKDVNCTQGIANNEKIFK